MAQLPKDQGGGDGRVAYIGIRYFQSFPSPMYLPGADAEGTFRPERIIQIAERFGIDGETAVENITVARANNSEHQHELLTQLNEQFATGEYRLLVVDSICALFRVDYVGRGELNERQQKLGVHLSRLQHMAEEFNITVFMTNQVQSDPSASALYVISGSHSK